MLFLDAMNVHQGGGRTLLAGLLRDAPPDIEIVALVDARMAIPTNIASSVSLRRIQPTLLGRLSAHWWLRNNAANGHHVLSFGGLPPLFGCSGRVTLFVQNRYLIDRSPLTSFPSRPRMRLMMERLWLKWRVSSVAKVAVQTPSMANMASRAIPDAVEVAIRPFTLSRIPSRAALDHPSSAPDASFVYVASGDPHKNHRRLIEAWGILAGRGIFPLLHLTVDYSTQPLHDWIALEAKRLRLRIINHGSVPPEQIGTLYSNATALIFPSLLESFGIPLLEAQEAGLPIIASELDYVRDVVDPHETFDPNSPISMARSVMRFIDAPREILVILTPAQFLSAALTD